jgi:SWI/SNF-related matrix-associated actin-dependent regulator 1 of chromatin subfamily A
LTGTPILNRPVEIHPLLSAIAPDQFGNFFSFAKRYCAAHQGRWGWEFDGASNLDELQERLRTICMVRRLKKDVLTELPAKTRQVIVVEPNGAGEVVRREAEAFARREDEIADLRAQADFAHASGDETAYKQAVQALRDRSLVAFTEMSEARHEVAIAKVPAVIAHLEGMLAEGVEKILVFAHHHDVVAALADRFGAEAVTLTGETPMNERDGIVQRFQSDTSVKIFIGSIRASGVGLTLTAAAHVVFAELDWTPANVTQAEDRCHRIGQENRLLVQHVVFDGSLDAKMAKMLVEKQGIADQALDDPFERDLPVASASESRPRQYPPTTPEQRAAALEALRRLAGVCDGAKLLDGQGFNKLDSKIGHRLASLGSLSDGQTWLASRLAMKYHRQLPADLLERIKSGSPSSLLIFS